MARKAIIILILSLSFVFSLDLALAAVDGEWEVTIRGVTKVKFKGERSVSFWAEGGDFFTFGAKGDFNTFGEDMEGTWLQEGKKFLVSLQPEAIGNYFGDLFEWMSPYYGYDIVPHNIVITKNAFSGTEGKDGDIIKGKYTLAITFTYSNGKLKQELPGSASVTAKFTGERY